MEWLGKGTAGLHSTRVQWEPHLQAGSGLWRRLQAAQRLEAVQQLLPHLSHNQLVISMRALLACNRKRRGSKHWAVGGGGAAGGQQSSEKAEKEAEAAAEGMCA